LVATRPNPLTSYTIALYGIRIWGRGTRADNGKRFWIVTSREYAQTNRCSIVSQAEGHLTCNCPATKPCVHICLCVRDMKAEGEQPQEERMESAPQSQRAPTQGVLVAAPAPQASLPAADAWGRYRDRRAANFDQDFWPSTEWA
jgi:hypothetical protein